MIGGIVEIIQTDLLCHHARQGGILILADLAPEQEDHAVARRFRHMAVGGVYEKLRIQQRRRNDGGEINVGGYFISVQRPDNPADDMAVFAYTAFEPAAYKTPVVFRRVALGLGKFRVLLGGFGRADRIAVAFLEVIPRPFQILVCTCDPSSGCRRKF